MRARLGSYLIVVASLLVGCGSVTSPGDPDATNGSNPDAMTGSKQTGEACSAPSECATGFCADGVCCDSACAGQCEACDVGTPGTCAAVSGAPVGGRTACSGGEGVCAATCDGQDRTQCTFPTIECGTSSCTGNVATTPTCAEGTCQDRTLDCTTTTDTKMCGLTTCAGVVDLAAGLWLTCAVLSDGTLKCWGDNLKGQLGQGGTDVEPRYQPTTVPGLASVKKVSIASGSGMHVCALLEDGTLTCWGDNRQGQLGINQKDTNAHTTPAPVLANAAGDVLSDIRDVSAGFFHTCAVREDKSVLCWGWGRFGRLADGDDTDHAALLPQGILPQGTLVDTIHANWGHTCASVGTGTSAQVRCWGINGRGECGAPASTSVTEAQSTSFTNLDGTLAQPLAVGAGVSCGISSSNATLRCWGDNFNGVLGRGDGSVTSTYIHGPVCKNNVTNCPSAADQLSGVTQATLGEGHGCAIVGNQVRCWGQNTNGQLGDGTNTHFTYAGTGPTLPLAAVKIVAGAYHTCAILSDRTVRCWGSNDRGELGNGDASGQQQRQPVAPVW
jgi:alpha-tubulin suppressor-like RCC1 family protein